VISGLRFAARVLADLVGFFVGAMVVPGVLIAGALDLMVCAVLFAVLSAAVLPLTPYVVCPVVLATLAPALLLVNSGLVWGAVRVGQSLGLGVAFSGVIAVLLVAGVIGAIRVAAAAATRAIWKQRLLRAAHAEYSKMGHTRVWYRDELNRRRGLEGASR
jgi:hypothetical protein